MLLTEEYAVLMKSDEKGWGLYTISVDGERVLAVFESDETCAASDSADLHAELPGVGEGWKSVVGSSEDILEVLQLASTMYEHLTINPPLAFKDGTVEEVRIIPIKDFMEAN